MTAVITKLVTTRPVVFWAVITLLALVAVSCGSEGGMYQGGGDDSPRWR